MIGKIENEFYPKNYSKSLSPNDDLSLCLVEPKLFSMHCLAVIKLNTHEPLKIQISKARRAIKKRTKAIYMFRGVGVYIVFIGDLGAEITKEDLTIDLTGLHAVIIQGIHVIPSSGKQVYKHSKWLGYTFGAGDGVAKRLENIAI